MSYKFAQQISKDVFEAKYQYKDETVEEMWSRLAIRVAASETESRKDRKKWQTEFYRILEGFKFIPGGRILANVGTSRRNVTYSNCYIQDYIPDDFDGIFEMIKEVAKTLRPGGGVGIDVSELRPKGARIYSTGGVSSGPLSFMEIFNATCRVIQAGNRRGAMIVMMNIHHYDIDDFIEAKNGTDYLSMFNMSVLVTDDFMRALKADEEWVLTYKDLPPKRYRARGLWVKILRNAYNHAEPGVLFKDTMIEANNLRYIEKDRIGVNPCGEQVLGMDYGTCLLGHMNLTQYVALPFTKEAEFNMGSFILDIPTAVRFLDDVLDFNLYPLEQQKVKALNTRRIGLGVTGYANMLVMLGIKYASEQAIKFTEKLFSNMMIAAYKASVALGEEKGSFPQFNRESYTQSGFLSQNWSTFNRHIGDLHGFETMRNSHLLSIAPTGTISILAGNVSSGIEPIFDLSYDRRVRQHESDTHRNYRVIDYAYTLFCAHEGEMISNRPPDAFVTYKDIAVYGKLSTLKTIQKYIDSSISNTTNIPNDYSFEKFLDIYSIAHAFKLKGVTVYRQGTMDAVLSGGENHRKSPQKKPQVISKVKKQLKRPAVLRGTTYKQKMMHNNYYITINNAQGDGILKPFEIFIDSTTYSPDATAVALLLSADFRRAKTYDDYDFIIRNLRKIQDPNVIIWDAKKKCKIRSLYQAISFILEEHIQALRVIKKPVVGKGTLNQIRKANGLRPLSSEKISGFCPKCKGDMKREGGCAVCVVCGYSTCE